MKGYNRAGPGLQYSEHPTRQCSVLSSAVFVLCCTKPNHRVQKYNWSQCTRSFQQFGTVQGENGTAVHRSTEELIPSCCYPNLLHSVAERPLACLRDHVDDGRCG